jgi:hypothetical protein
LFLYKNERECGLKIESKYVNGIVFPFTTSQELHNYFVYHATGQLPLDNDEPMAKILKNGNKSIEYNRMDKQVENFKTIMGRLKFEIEQTGFTFTNPKYSGRADIIAFDNNIKTSVANKKRIIISLVTTSAINDKWNPLGWADENVEEKWDLMIEAVHYKQLAKYEWGIDDIPFYFMVFSNKNDWEYKVFEVNVTEHTRSQHYNNLGNIKTYLDSCIEEGWKPKPNYKLCRECPLEITCKHSTDIPHVNKITI